MTKIIFFDIDGTLIDMGKKYISQKTIETLNKLHKNGIRICIATGRSSITLPDLHGIEFDAFLTFNGSYCYTKKEQIFSNPIPQNDVLQLIKNASLIHRPVAIATKNKIAINGNDIDLMDYFAIANEKIDLADNFDELCQKEIFQIMLGCRKKDYDQILENVKGAKIAAWWDRAVDVIPKTGGKGNGIRKMLEYYQIEKEEAMAFGDGNNDIEMFQAVGKGIAMGNASSELKMHAFDSCDTAANDGIYKYCVENHLF